MRNVVVWIVLALGFAACGKESSPTNGQAPSSPARDWVTLFDGSGLGHWEPTGDANWRVADGAVMADGGSGFLVSREVYGDFDLQLEFFVSPDANSGVFIRCANSARISAASCYEVNIYDRRPDPTYRTGGIVEVAKPNVMIDTGNRWNDYEISAHGRHLVVKLNGQTTVDVEDEKFAVGPFALQYAAGQVKFRNVRIRPN